MGIVVVVLLLAVLVWAGYWAIKIFNESWNEQLADSSMTSENEKEWFRALSKRFVRNIRYHLPF